MISRARVKRFLNGTTAAELKKNLKYAPQWVRALVFSIMEDAK